MALVDGLTEMYMKDKKLQADLREYFTQEPTSMREMFLRIEAGAADCEFIEGEIINDVGEPADEMIVGAINDAVDRQMLAANPQIREQQLQYKDGFFVPLDYRDLKEMKRTEGIR
jgi:hypothetical protein